MLPARLLLIFVFALALRGNAQPLPDRRELSGRIATPKSVPVAGAQIQIKRKEPNANAVFWGATMLSNVAGEFSVPNAEDGDYVVTVIAPGYEIWSSPYTLREYEPPLRIVLKRKVSLTFTLLNADGEPVRNKRAAVFGFVTQTGQWQLDNRLGTPLGFASLTTSTGECALSGVSEGIYHELYVAVRGNGFARWTGGVEILEGGTHHFDLRLQKAPASLQIKVIEASPDSKEKGRPIGAAQIYPQSVQPLQASDKALASWLFQQNTFTTNESTGEVQFTNLLPGRYQIRVTIPYHCKPVKHEDSLQIVDIEPNQEKELLFRLPQCAPNQPSLQVTLNDERGVPLTNREIRLYCTALDETTQMPLQVLEAKERQLPMNSTRRGITDAQGKLTIYPFWSGLWKILVTESDARIPFHGFGTVNVAPEGGQITIATTLNPEIEE